MEDKTNILPPMANKYIIRKTGEEVEILAFNQPDKGGRSNYEKGKDDWEYDWVSYIDSSGYEHIKEHLNILFDFKPVVSDTWNKLFDYAKPNKYPTIRNCRIYETAREIFINSNIMDIEEAVKAAINLVDKVGIETE